MKTAEEMYPYLPNEENDIAIREYNQLMYGRREAYNEGVKAMQSYASHPSPMSAEQVVRWVKVSEKEPPLEKFLHILDDVGHKRLGNFFTDYGELKLSICGTEMYKSFIVESKHLDHYYWLDESTTPSVKAEGLVSVDKEKEFHKVLKCLKNNKVMVDTREDGIYIRLAGRESEGEAFTLHFALAYPFPKLPAPPKQQ